MWVQMFYLILRCMNSTSELEISNYILTFHLIDCRKLDGFLATLLPRMKVRIFQVLFHFILKGSVSTVLSIKQILIQLLPRYFQRVHQNTFLLSIILPSLFGCAATHMVNLFLIIHGLMPTMVSGHDIIQSSNAVCLSLQLLVQGYQSVIPQSEIKFLMFQFLP